MADGGAVLCNTPARYQRLKRLRNYGSSKKYYNEEVGFNSRLDEIQAAFLLIKLKKLDELNEKKRLLASLYLQNLKQDFRLPVVQAGYRDVYHIFNVRHPMRDDLKTYLAKNQVFTEIHYPVPPSQQKALQGLVSFQSTPISDEIHATTLSLPISSFHSPGEISRVIEIMNRF